MNQASNIINIDTSRMRKGMRGLAHEIAVDIANPMNLDLWKPLPSSDPHRITATEILGTLGTLAELWSCDDQDAACRITHMSLLVLHAVQSQQYSDPNMVGRAMRCQAAAESVRLRLEELDASRQVPRNSGSQAGG
jgi:hypothetical protein